MVYLLEQPLTKGSKIKLCLISTKIECMGFFNMLNLTMYLDFYTTVYCYHVGVVVLRRRRRRPNTFSFRTLTLLKVNRNL